MRKIKFRAWDNVKKEWVIAFSIPNIGWQKIENEPITDIEIMQYTGLFDKNGKEIYEGDIIEHKFSDGSGDKKRTSVEFQDGAFMPLTEGASCGCCSPVFTRLTEIEVIGNIYENKDLL